MKMERIFEKIARQVSPSEVELKKEKKFAARLISKLESKLPKNARVSFVGSAARDTGLKGDRDIDLFVAFPRNLKEAQIVKTTFTATKKAIKAKWVMHYAEHPYLQTTIGCFKVEVIPCFKVEPHSGIKSAVDRSPLHMDYLQKKLTQRQRRDVRVLKKLLKTHGIYGAEVEVAGFSGLVCEQLILKYSCLENLLREAAKWIPPIIIDVEKIWNIENKQVHKELLKKFNGKLILIDVIDRNRNAAAAISPKCLAKFILLAGAFNKKQHVSFFKQKKKKHSFAKVNKALKKRGTTFILIEFKKPNIIEDILYPQLKKSERSVTRELEKSGFEILGSCENFEKAQLLIEVVVAELPKVKKVIGPPAWDAKSVGRFLAGKKPIRGPYLCEEKVCIDIEVKERKVVKILKNILKSSATGIASHFVKPAKNARVKILKKVSKKNVEIVSNYCLEKEEWI